MRRISGGPHGRRSAACCRPCCCPCAKYEELNQRLILVGTVCSQRYRCRHRLSGLHRRCCRRQLSGGDRQPPVPWRRGLWVALRGGSGQQICHAVAMALKNLLGLICDPVAGLVEVPCGQAQCRRSARQTAVSAADMALAGIESRIPVGRGPSTPWARWAAAIPVEFPGNSAGRSGADTPTGKAIGGKNAGADVST